MILLLGIFIIRMEISSHPCAFVGFRASIISLMSSSLKETSSKIPLVSNLKFGRVLPESISVHCFAKKSLNRFAFSWKSVMKMLFRYIGGISDIFASFKNVLMRDQTIFDSFAWCTLFRCDLRYVYFASSTTFVYSSLRFWTLSFWHSGYPFSL